MVAVKLVFSGWTKSGKRVADNNTTKLSMGDFHSGTVFNGHILLDENGKADFDKAIKLGYEPQFIVCGDNYGKDT